MPPLPSHHAAAVVYRRLGIDWKAEFTPKKHFVKDERFCSAFRKETKERQWSQDF